MDGYVREGRLTPEQATRHPDRHVLPLAPGLEPVLQSDLVPADVLIGNVLLLSSDQLIQMLPDQHREEIAHSQRDNPLLAGKALIQAALDTGGIDNSPVVACSDGGPTRSGKYPLTVPRSTR